MKKASFTIIAALLVGAIGFVGIFSIGSPTEAQSVTKTHTTAPTPTEIRTAVFAGGCFWCVESDFDKVPGVIETISGYTGGTTASPSYEEVTYADTGHYEAVQISYDPAVVSYTDLVSYFFRHVDPTDDGGQFCDRGHSYKSAIFARPGQEAQIATDIKTEIDNSKVLTVPIVTPILPLSEFWPAEGYHQDYYQKNPLRYKYYRRSCGRDARVKKVWKNAIE